LTPEQLLTANGIALESYAPGRHYTTCPQCSRNRKTADYRKSEVLGVTIEADGAARWGCNHCGWTGPEKGVGAKPELTAYEYRDAGGVTRFRKVRNSPAVFRVFGLSGRTAPAGARGRAASTPPSSTAATR
jgi:hypothetical protein